MPPTSSFMPADFSQTVRAFGSRTIRSEPTSFLASASFDGSGRMWSRRARRQSRPTGAIVTSKAPPDRSYMARERASTSKRSGLAWTGLLPADCESRESSLSGS